MFDFIKKINQLAKICCSSYAQRIKFIVRSVIFFSWSNQWLFFLENHHVAREFFLNNPRIFQKIHRPYLRKNLFIGSRSNVLCNHFKIMGKIVPKNIWRPLAMNERIDLALLKGCNDLCYRVELKQTHFDKEGELSIHLFDTKNKISLAIVTFSLTGCSEEPIISIGGLQGAPNSIGPDPIRMATKALHGLRPKQTVLLALMIISKWLGSQRILATSNKNHIYRVWWRGKRKVIHADYDLFWAEQNNASVCTKSNDFNIDTTISLRSAEEIPSRKRAKYMRRYLVIDQMRNAIHQRLHL